MKSALRDDRDEVMRAFGWTMNDVFRLLQRSWNRCLRNSGTGITPPQSRILTALHANGGLTQTELAFEVEMDKAPLGRLLDRLEELGFIERQLDPADRRVRRINHTVKALALDEPMWRAAGGLFAVALDGFSPAEIETLISLLDRLKQNLLAEDAAAMPAAGRSQADAASTAKPFSAR